MPGPSRWRTLTLIGLMGALVMGACSPEAVRRRDGGAGGDGDNHGVQASAAKPHAADTTLWPGRAAAPVERLAAGTMPMPPRPAPPAPTAASAPSSQSPKPTAATPTDGRAFDKGKGANPRRAEPKKP